MDRLRSLGNALIHRSRKRSATASCSTKADCSDDEPITLIAQPRVWRAVLRTLKQSPETDPFYHALFLEIELALDEQLDEYLQRCAD